MAKFPEPPGVAALARLTPVTKTLDAGTRIFRIFRSGGKHPMHWNSFRYFGPTSARFDHQLPNKMGKGQSGPQGIMYGAVGAKAVPTCLAEVFQNSRTINRRDKSPVLCAFTLTESVTLLDLTGTFPTQIGASMAINTGTRSRAQRWARQLYQAFPLAQGIYYSSSMYGNNPALALFERASPAIPNVVDMHRQLDDPVLRSVIYRTSWDIAYPVVV